MSLTTELKDPNSLISLWMKENMRPSAVQSIVNNFNAQLARRSPIWIDGVDPALVGTAFDYAFRWEVQPLESSDLVAMHGARIIDLQYFEDSPAIRAVASIVALGNEQPALRSKCSVVLAWFEGVFRGGRYIEKVRDFLVRRRSPESILNTVPELEVRDIQQLTDTIKPTWGDRLVSQYIPNPTFTGSVDVGGADADWIFGQTLYDCKTSRKRQPFDFQHFLQIIGYVLLDYNDTYKTQNVGWYFARQQTILEMSINRIFRDLPKSRESLRQHLSERAQS